MPITIKPDGVILKCARCNDRIEARFTMRGKVAQVGATITRLNAEAKRRKWDTDNDLCPKHK